MSEKKIIIGKNAAAVITHIIEKVFGTIKCYAKAVQDLVVYGAWMPHVYSEGDYERCIIIATDSSFRVSKGLEHTSEETVHPDACLIRSYCICCGKKDLSWMPDWNEAMIKLGG